MEVVDFKIDELNHMVDVSRFIAFLCVCVCVVTCHEYFHENEFIKSQNHIKTNYIHKKTKSPCTQKNYLKFRPVISHSNFKK